MIIGTHCFVDLQAACSYYAEYGFDIETIRRKVADYEIVVGEPPLSHGESLMLIDDNRRYAIKVSVR